MTLTAELRHYSNACISGGIPACNRHRWACARFIRDIERKDTDAFPFVFDESRSERFFDWMRLFKHRKGILRGKHIEPDIIQKFVFGNLYGWKHRETGYRRFRKMYWQVARKNAKSQSLSCLGSFETSVFLNNGESPETSEVYVAATKTEQAKIVYDETVAMIQGCKLIKDKFRVAYGRIEHIKTGSIMRPLSEEDRKTGDGLNPQCGIIDEYHAHEDSLIYDVIDSGMGARAQPLLAIITTAGFELNNPCYRVEYNMVTKILDPDNPIEDDSYFVMINELEKNETPDTIVIGERKIAPGELIDDINDESTWPKANPIICSYPEGVAYLRGKVREAQNAPEKRRNLLTKHFNVWVNERESGYMVMEKWAACKRLSPNLRGEWCWLGLDLSAKIDLVSVWYEFKLGDMYHVFGHSFMPEDTMAAKMETDKIPYDVWASQGWITLIPGQVVDYRAVKRWAQEHAAEMGWKITEWCLDPWGATQLTGDLQDEGETVVEIIQGIKTLSEPTKDFRDMVYSGRVVHDGNPVIAWAIGNAIVDSVDRNENILLNKKKSKQRIDPIAAGINAHVRAMHGEGGSVYNRRGMLSLGE